MRKFANLKPMDASTLLNELEQATRAERGMRPGNSLRDHLAEVVFKRFTVQEAPAPVADPVAAALWKAQFEMEMHKWHWKSEASTDGKRAAHKAVADALATLRKPTNGS